MNTLTAKSRAKKVWFDERSLWILLKDGRKISIPLGFFPRLKQAKRLDLEKFTLSGDGTGIHWESLDEDISVPGLLNGIGDLTKK
ncbi:MAG: DUF2442 domain-containing protein [Spirochaetia bacterium]|nr:DUF2442 domain-containing protein [Spirochaetia bacterium]